MTMFPIDIDFSRIKEVLTYDPQAPMIFSSGIFLWLFTAFLVVYNSCCSINTLPASCLSPSFLITSIIRVAAPTSSCLLLSRFAISFWRSSWRVPKAIGSVKGW